MGFLPMQTSKQTLARARRELAIVRVTGLAGRARSATGERQAIQQETAGLPGGVIGETRL